MTDDGRPEAPASEQMEVKRHMPGTFVLKKTGYHVVLKAANGETIAHSEVYKSKASALNGIESVTKNASAPVSETGE